jgi:hypothetical protein
MLRDDPGLLRLSVVLHGLRLHLLPHDQQHAGLLRLQRKLQDALHQRQDLEQAVITKGKRKKEKGKKIGTGHLVGSLLLFPFCSSLFPFAFTKES